MSKMTLTKGEETVVIHGPVLYHKNHFKTAAIKCPTCEDAKDNCCCCCGREIDEKDRAIAPHPLTDILHLMCYECGYD